MRLPVVELVYNRAHHVSAPKGLPYVYLRLVRWELFIQRETVQAARYGFTREGRGAGILDLPGWSIAYANVKRWEEARA